MVEKIFDSLQLEPLPWLNAVITEPLRLHPPVPTSGPQTTGQSGLLLDDFFILPGIILVTPRYSMSRHKIYFHAIFETW